MPSTTTLTVRFFYVYVLQSLKDGNKYVGLTVNLKKDRIEERNKGLSFSTKPRNPLRLIYFRGGRNYEDTKRREKYLKRTGGRRFLAKRLREYNKSKL